MPDSNNSFKFGIQLTREQIGSFPVSIEHLWFDKHGEYYQLKNIPQFVDEVSYDDLVEIRRVDESYFVINRVIKPSKNCTIWILFASGHYSDADEFFNKMRELGCGVEGGALKGYYALNVPQEVNIEECYRIIDSFENEGRLVSDYPCTR